MVNEYIVISFHNKKLSIPFNYTLDNKHVNRGHILLNLGAPFDSTLTFNQHFEAVMSKSLKMLGIIKRSTVDFRSANAVQLFINPWYCRLSHMDRLYGLHSRLVTL